MKNLIITFRSVVICAIFLVSCRGLELEETDVDPQTEGVTPLTISKSEAKDIAIKFFHSDTKSLDPQASIGKTNINSGFPKINSENISEINVLLNDKKQPIMYAVNLKDNSGYVLVSASTVETPVLAYSDIGKFDFNEASNYGGISSWVSEGAYIIGNKIKIGKKPNKEVIEKWQALGYYKEEKENNNKQKFLAKSSYSGCKPIENYQPIFVEEIEDFGNGPLLKTEWNQSSYNGSYDAYNNFVKYNNCSNGTTPAGCVAVAMGQIMKYYNWPNIYNIKNMPNKVNINNHNTANSKNIAYFLKHIGASVNMNYRCSRSGAFSDDARKAFINKYKYKTSQLEKMDSYYLTKNIESNKPVYMDGCRMLDGKYDYHAWVADGVKYVSKRIIEYGPTYPCNEDDRFEYCIPTQTYIHMNWGWGGIHNGWYHFWNWDNIDGRNIDIVNFTHGQHMIYDIVPNK